jgi:hypothetical protein
MPDLDGPGVCREIRNAVRATHDALTSPWNRGVMMELLGRELARSARENPCTAILEPRFSQARAEQIRNAIADTPCGRQRDP